MDEITNQLNQEDAIKETMEMYFEEYLAGGFDENYLRDDVLEIFGIIEECQFEEKPYPVDLVQRWSEIPALYK